MRTNPFTHLYAEANKGNSKEKLKNLPEFPRLIDIEVTNVCNFRCLMCPTGNRMMSRKSGYMEKATFYKIVDQIKGKNVGLRFIGWGEPLGHPEYLEFITYAKKQGILCHMNTNGSKLTREIMELLCDLEFESIKFSFQGVDQKSYREMRNTDYFNELLEVIRTMYEIRGERPVPFMQVSSTITYESPEMVEDFKEHVQKFTDFVNVGYTNLEHIDVTKVKLKKEEKVTLVSLKSHQIKFGEHPECPEVFDKLTINFDGTITACAGDFNNLMLLGDLNKSTIDEIWMSSTLFNYREMLADMQHDKLKLCSTCYSIYEPEGRKKGTTV